MEIINDLRNCPLVSNNGIATQNNSVPFLHHNVSVCPKTNTRETSHFLPLTPGGDDKNLPIGDFLNTRTCLAYKTTWDTEVSQIFGNLNVLLHAPPRNEHLPIEFPRMFYDLLDTIEGGA